MEEGRPYILNVDDNEAVRYARTRTLERAGYRVVEAGTGSEALALTRRDRPNLVILDVKLPDSWGTDICQQIREDPTTADTMILQISAFYTSSVDRTAGLRSGADAYLTEPVPAEEFLASAQALLRRASRDKEFGAGLRMGKADPERDRPTTPDPESNEAEDQIRELSSRLATVKERERETLAQSLHDDLAQLLVVARMKLHQNGHSGPAVSIKEADAVLEQCLTYTRSLMSDLMPPEMSNGRLDVALRWLAARMGKHGLRLVVNLPEEAIAVTEDTAMTVLKSVRELLFNVLKHAGTREASVTMSRREDFIHIVVQDRGKGYDGHPSHRSLPHTFGLLSVQQRMKSLNGRLEMTSKVGEGTCATMVFPYIPLARPEVQPDSPLECGG